VLRASSISVRNATAAHRWPAFCLLSLLLHGVALASLTWIPATRWVQSSSSDEGDEGDEGDEMSYVIQLDLRASALAPLLAPEPDPEPVIAQALEPEPEPTPEPVCPPNEPPPAPVVTTRAEEAQALASSPAPQPPAAPEKTSAIPETTTAAPAGAQPAPQPAGTPATAAPDAHAAAARAPIAAPPAAKAGAARGLDDGLNLRALRADRPEYPEDARRRSEEGSVTCRLTIDRNGRVIEVEIVQSSGSRSLDQAAVRALKRWRFEPLARDSGLAFAHILKRLSFELQSARP
jgi:protein TonB